MDKAQLTSILEHFGEGEAIATVLADSLPLREELPSRRRTEREKVDINLGMDGLMRVYIEVGFYEDGRPGEVFLKCGKQGTMVRDMFDALSIVLSVSMQHGIPLKAFPITGRGNVQTGEGNELIDTLIKKVEELCTTPVTTSDASPSSTESTTPPSDSETPPGS